MHFLTNLVIIVQRENDNTLVLIIKRSAGDILLKYNKKKKYSEGSIRASCELLKSSAVKGNLY